MYIIIMKMKWKLQKNNLIEPDHILDLENMIYQLKEMKILQIEEIQISDQLQEILEIQIKRNNQLNNNILDFCQNKGKCSKCDRRGEYVLMNTNEILCWNHSI